MSHGIAISKDSLDAILGELRRRDERVDARYKMILDQMMAMAPMLFSDLFGKGDGGRDPLVERFLAVLTPEQIDAIVKVLGAEQSVMLVEIAQRYAHVPPVDPQKAEQA